LCVRRSAAPEELSRRLVVCTDLSPAAMAAVELAGEVASKLGSAVNLVHVCDGAKHWRRRDGAPIDVERDLGAALARIYAEALPRGAEIAVLRGGSVVDMLTGHAVAMGADLMVLATHGRTGVRRLFVGSVAERVTRHAPCSVLVARAAFAP
jgi:nucleotide-binding universal stress UspA family protein